MGQKNNPVCSIQYIVRVVNTTDREEVWPDAEAAEEGGQGVLWTVWESRDRQTGVGVQCRQGQSQRSRSVSQVKVSHMYGLQGGLIMYNVCKLNFYNSFINLKRIMKLERKCRIQRVQCLNLNFWQSLIIKKK